MIDEIDILDGGDDTAPAKPKATKPKATKPKAAPVAADDEGRNEVAEEAEGLELLYLGKKDPKVVEMPDGCIHTFKRAFPRDHARATITCEACFVKMMNIAGPGAAKPEDVIFVPPTQLKPFLAMKNAAAKQREESLSILSQPWKQQEMMRKAQNGEED